MDLLDAHGARGAGHGNPSDFSEVDRWTASKALFLCIPADIVTLRAGKDKFIPFIGSYLDRIKVTAGMREHQILKGVCEQMLRTNSRYCASHGLTVRRKYGVSDVRAQGQYAKLLTRQSNRCATCGLLLDHADSVELDHSVPFSIIGDVSDGSNWRLLCDACNKGKHNFLSALLSPDSWNWVAVDALPRVSTEGPTLRGRYAVMASRPRCEHESCNEGPGSSELEIVRINEGGLYVPANLRVLCQFHAQQQVSEAC